MASLGYTALQKALFQKLSSDTTLSALITGVFDRPPQDIQFPYAQIGDMQGKDWSTKTSSGMEYEVKIHIWSREGGRRQSSLIMERIYNLLHQGSLSIETHALVQSWFVSAMSDLENDGVTYRSTMEFRVLMQSN